MKGDLIYASRIRSKTRICEIGKRLYAKGYVAAKHGNISYKYSENEYFCTPRGVSKVFLTPDKIVKVDANGKKIGNCMYEPTSEVTLHIRMYQENPEIRALIHAQPPFSTAYAIKNVPINNCVLPENYVYLGVVPKGAYNVFSTGDTLENAFDNVDSLEFYAKMNFIGSHIPDGAGIAEVVSDHTGSEAVVKAVTEQIMRELGM